VRIPQRKEIKNHTKREIREKRKGGKR